MTILYLSGCITNSDPKKELENRKQFIDTENRLKERFPNIYNPVSFEKQNWAWENYLAYDLRWIELNRPVMYFMEGWEQSLGARLERCYAQQLGLVCLYEKSMK